MCSNRKENTLGIISRCIWLICICLAGNASAVSMSKSEYDLLPVYCKNQGNVSERYYKPDNETKWRRTLEKNYGHIHHYCWAMVHIARSYKAGLPESQRRYNLTSAIADIQYSLERSTEDFALIPEMYTRLGEAYLGLRDDKNAEVVFEKAWTVNPAYSPAYVWWAQHLLSQGKKREALAVAEEGMKNSPDSKSLDKLIKDIQRAGRVTNK